MKIGYLLFFILNMLVMEFSFSKDRISSSQLLVNLTDDRSIHSFACSSCEEVKINISKFSNGNSDVQILSNVSQKAVVVVTPQNLTTDSLMELLIAVRVLKTQGASSVIVEISDGDLPAVRIKDVNGQVLKISLELLLSIAGASKIVSVLEETDISEISLKRQLNNMRVSRSDLSPMIDIDFYPELGHQLSQKMGIKILVSNDSVIGRDIYLLSTQTSDSNDILIKTINRIEYLTRMGANVHLITPYLPYSRSDKIDRVGVTTTGSLIADFIEISGTKAIYYVRAHAQQSSGFFKNIRISEASSFSTLAQIAKDNHIDIIIAPDSGAQKEATKLADLLGLPVGVVNKQRHGDIVEVKGMSLPNGFLDLNDKNILIVDDETASGSTLKEAAEYSKKLGARNVYTAVTHLAGDAKHALNTSTINKLFVSDTIPITISHPKLVVLPISEELTDLIIGKKNVNRSMRCANIFIK